MTSHRRCSRSPSATSRHPWRFSGCPVVFEILVGEGSLVILELSKCPLARQEELVLPRPHRLRLPVSKPRHCQLDIPPWRPLGNKELESLAPQCAELPETASAAS